MKLSEQLQLEASIVKRCINGPNGDELIGLLEHKFDGELVGEDTYDTYRKIGARQVVKYLKELSGMKTTKREPNPNAENIDL